MLDFELAEIYGYETRAFNQQVKRNNEKFDEDFMFQLTDEEMDELSRSKNVTLNKGTGRGSNIKYKPYAFTEQGIYMLMTVLRGELAIKQNKALIRMFKQMKDFIIENQDFIGSKDLVQIAIQTNRNTNDIAKINDKISTLATKEDLKKVMDNFIDPDTYKHFLLMNGDKIEADVAYTKLYKSAKKSIYVVDNYIGLKTLELGDARRKADIIMPACECAMTVHHAGYSSLSEAYGAIVNWIVDNGYEIADVPFEIYTKNQFDSLSQENWETEVYFPIIKNN